MCSGTGLKHLDDSEALIEFSNDMDNIYENSQKCNPDKEQKILIVVDELITDMLSNNKPNRKRNLIEIERGRKLLIFFVFITQY